MPTVSARRRQRVIAALGKAAAHDTEIGVSSIARAAAVDRSFLYRHRDLLSKIHALEAPRPSPATQPGLVSPGHLCKPTSWPPKTAPSA